jgi:uncharacterized delta-60 repeat protein
VREPRVVPPPNIVYGRPMTRLRSSLVLSMVLVSLAAAPAAAGAPGQLDPSFGSAGQVRLFPSEESLFLKGLAVQPDQKVVLAGAEDPGSVIVVRLLHDGRLDPGFGQGGKVSTPFPGGFGEARAVTVQADGKIVIAGAVKGLLNNEFLIARYNGDGSLDASFGGGDGIAAVPVGAGSDSAEAVAIGSGGRVLATGRSEIGSSDEGAGVAVLKSNGEPDPTFAGDGTTIVEATSDKSDRGEAIAEVAGGRILIGDSTGNGAGDGFTLVRLLSTGLPDPEFGGGDGIVKTEIPGSDDGRLTDFVLRPDGRIVASGYAFDEVGAPATSDEKFAAVGYLANGDLDGSFGSGGIFTHQVGPGEDGAGGIERTPKDQLLLAGYYRTDANGLATLRLTPGGALDAPFGNGGQVLLPSTAPVDNYFEESALDAEERLLMLSTEYTGGGQTVRVVTRLLGDKVPPQPLSVVLNQLPHAQMKAVPRKAKAKKLRGFSGAASDPDGHGLKAIEIALVRRVVKRGGGKARLRCFALKNSRQGFKRTRPMGKRCPQRWLTVKGTAKWSFKLKGQLPLGRYVVFARAIDGLGSPETAFSRKLRNRYGFRVLPTH